MRQSPSELLVEAKKNSHNVSWYTKLCYENRKYVDEVVLLIRKMDDPPDIREVARQLKVILNVDVTDKKMAEKIRELVNAK